MFKTLKELVNSRNLITRRNIIKLAVGSVSLGGLYLLFSSLKNQKNIDSKREKVIISKAIAEGITLSGTVIIKKEGSDLTVFSSKCTHLGCTINRMENDMLICPCHGSKFNKNGDAISGPASKPLEKLPVIKDNVTGELFVNI